MTKDEILAAAKAASLPDPRVMPFRLRTGEVAQKLYFGPPPDRRSVLVMPDASPDILNALLRDG